MKRTTLNLGPFGIYLWGAILLVGGLAFAGGAALTANSRGTIFPQQLANGTAVPGYIAVAGYCTDTATGTSAGTSVANGQCWKEIPSTTLPVGTAGRVLGVVRATATRTVAVTGTQTSVGTETYSYTTTATQTTTATMTGATATYTFTSTSTVTSVTSAGSAATSVDPLGVTHASNLLWVVGEGKLQRYSLTNPTTPSYIGETALYDTNNLAVCASDDGSFLFVGNSLRIQAFTSASPPSYVNYVNAYSQPYGCAVSGARLYVALYNYSQIEIFNIADLGSITSLGRVSTSYNGPLATARYQGYILVSDGSSSRLESMQIVGNSLTSAGSAVSGSSPFGVATLGTKAFLLNNLVSGVLQAFDISTPSSPSWVADIPIAANPRAITIRNNYAYVTFPSENLVRAYDLSMYGAVIGTATQTTTNSQTGTVTQSTTTTAAGTQTVATIETFTAAAIGTATATGSDKWTAVNGTIKAGDNIRLTKGNGTDPQTEVALMDEPTVQLYSVDLPKTIRSTGATIPASGVGAELFYSPYSEISYLVSIDRGAAVHKPLNISGSSIRFAIDNNVTMLVPETAGTEGDVLTKGGSNSSTWAPNIPIAPVTFTCATSATDLTITTSFTLGTGNGVVLSVGPITPKSTTTALRFRIGYQGKGIASTPLVANVQALTDPSYATWVANAGMANTVGNGDYTSGFNDVVAWDAQWVNPTTFQLLMTGVLLPFATGSARACLEIEELRM